MALDQTRLPQALNRALREAVEFVHAEGWDASPTLFGLVDAELLAAATGGDADSTSDSPLALVVQDLPDFGSPDEMADYLARTAWPPHVIGAILSQEIMFTDTNAPSPTPAPARLIVGVLADGPHHTLLQLRPTEEELAADPFAQDKIELLGGDVAPQVVALLQATFEAVLDPDD